jgi:hypothetical protein
MGMTVAEKKLQSEKSYADLHVREYDRALNSEKESTAQMLDSAIGKFYEFLQIPPKSNRFLDILSGAWKMASTIVPLLGGVKMAQNLFVVCVKAEELTVRMAPVMRAGQRLASAADKISEPAGKMIEAAKKASESYHTIDEAIEKMGKENPEPTKAFEKLEIAKAIRLDFIHTLYLRKAAVDKADAALVGEYTNRLNGIRANPDATLDGMAERLLPTSTAPTDNELDQMETAILYQTIRLYLQRNVNFTRNVVKVYPSGDVIEDREEDYLINGVNSEQIDMFAEWFGFPTRGKYFNPPFVKVWLESNESFFRRIMKLAGCSVVDHRTTVDYGRHRGEV